MSVIWEWPLVASAERGFIPDPSIQYEGLIIVWLAVIWERQLVASGEGGCSLDPPIQNESDMIVWLAGIHVHCLGAGTDCPAQKV
jgi:hypothetical protein